MLAQHAQHTAAGDATSDQKAGSKLTSSRTFNSVLAKRNLGLKDLEGQEHSLAW